MRIIHAYRSGGDSLGIYRAIRELAIAQARSGAEVHLVVHGAWPEDDVGRAGVRVHQGGIASGLIALHRLARGPATVHAHMIWSPWAMLPLLLRRARGVRFVISAHGSLAAEALKHKGAKKRLAWWLMFRRAVSRHDAVIATSEPERADIEAFRLGPPVLQIPNTVSPPDAAVLDGVTKQRVVGFIGRLHPIKGAKELAEAWARVSSEFPGWRLRLVGPADEGAYLDAIAAIAAETGTIHIDEPIYDPGKWRVMAECEIVAVPSRSENFCYVVAEALLAGTPVLASTGVPWPEIETLDLGWRGEGDVDGIERLLRRALSTTSDERAVKGARGRDFVNQRYGHAVVAAMSMAAYRGLRA